MTAMLMTEMPIGVFTGKWNDCRRREKRHLPLLPAFLTHPRAKHLTLSAKVKSLFLASFLCLPCSWLALSIGDNTHVPDSLKYVFSPGTTTIAVLTNVVFYGTLIFGFAMIFLAAKRRE
ncbi:MAG TPA: hypothetical protein VFR84_08660 [Candidatus Angelobacter sp.]|nr:hypothetical protein [Candidatus Angelobacter sp.]